MRKMRKSFYFEDKENEFRAVGRPVVIKQYYILTVFIFKDDRIALFYCTMRFVFRLTIDHKLNIS